MKEEFNHLRPDNQISSRNDLWLAAVISMALHGTLLMAFLNLRPAYHPAVYGTGSGPSVVHFVSGTFDGATEGDAATRSLPVEIAENPPSTAATLLEPVQSEPLVAVGLVNEQPPIADVADGRISGAIGGNGPSRSEGMGGGYDKPTYLRNPPPSYPRVAREHGWEGTTLLQMEVLADGTSGKIGVLTSSGYEVLDEEAVKTVSRWRFLPAQSGNTPVRSFVEIPIRFRMTGD